MKSANINAYLSIFKNFITTNTPISVSMSLKTIPPRLNMRNVLFGLFLENSQKMRNKIKFNATSPAE